jgi:predicted nucleic acid-binding protein
VNRIYLDACAIIYFVETISPFHAAVVSRLMRLQSDPNSRLLTSRLSCLECRISPIRRNDKELLATYDSLFSTSRLILIEISEAVIEQATALRANHGFKTPGAIHLASAIEAKADLFLTGDASLALPWRGCRGPRINYPGGSRCLTTDCQSTNSEFSLL